MSNTDWTIADLEAWDEKITVLVEKFGLDCYPQQFEICDVHQMLEYIAYSGLPAHYPHWCYGKHYEQHKTRYNYGVEGLPYEMVINSNPCLAYLVGDNSLLLQILTMAHVYAHNDFFKNNKTFEFSGPEHIMGCSKIHANRVRGYVEDPSIGEEKVEAVLDAAHALAYQRQRNPGIKKLSREEQIARIQQKFNKPPDQYQRQGLHPQAEFNEEGLQRALEKNPLESEENLLLFIRDNRPHLSDWEKDLLTIVDEETEYFIPQINTKIMNEGWASYWHKRILEALDLPSGLREEFMVRHSQVVRPFIGDINPYHLGFKIWQALHIWYNGSLDRSLLNKDQREEVLFEEMRLGFEEDDNQPPFTGEWSGDEMIFFARETNRDESFLRQYLTPLMMRQLDMFQYEGEGEKRVITRVSTDDDWRVIKQTLLKNVGMGSFPVIKVEDAGYGGRYGHLLLKHYHDGRDLYIEYMNKTLGFAKKLWGGKVTLETVLNGKPMHCFIDQNGELHADFSGNKK